MSLEKMSSVIKRLLEKAPATKRYLSKNQPTLKADGLLKRLLDKVGFPKRDLSKKTTAKNPQGAQEMAHPLEHATGLEKKEMLAFLSGKCDPYHSDVIKRGSGTAENPTLIPSAFHGRIVGCICCDNRFVNFMWLEKGCPKRCECGYWFKLTEVEAFS
uniref:Cytochrome c oxidase subunit 5B, mitochondrial n=1 Tax=Glossina pallidipes TaxID=7398 RepID=A0A1B0ABJ5_GLOPL